MGHERLVDRLAELAPARPHVAAHLALGDLRALLVAQALPDPLGRVALLGRRLPVGGKPAVDQRPVGPSFGAGLRSGRLRGGGRAAASA